MNAVVQPPEFESGSVWLVGAGPGDPGLLTLNACAALEQADLVLYDALVAPEILKLARSGARLESVGKRAGQPSARQLRINQRLIDGAKRGERVVRLKNGDPFVFGRGGEEALALAAAGVSFRVVPGITAATAASAYAGIPITHRMLAQSVALVTGHGAGSRETRVDWASLAKGAETLVLYMAMRPLPEIAKRLLAAGRAESEAVAILQDATTPRERQRQTTLGAVAQSETLPEASPPTLVVIGPTVSLGADLLPFLQTDPAEVAAVERQYAEGDVG